MRNRNKLLTVLIMLIAMTGCQTVSTPIEQGISTADGMRQLNKIESIQWDKTGEAFSILNNLQLDANQSRIVFIHDHLDQTIPHSINIDVDSAFHTSLHPGQYSQSIVCNGEQVIGIQNSAVNTNTFNDQIVTPFFQPQQTYYYQVSLDPQSDKASINPVEEAVAFQLLQGLSEQTHQKNRVEAKDCTVIEKETETVEPPAPVEVNKPITLDVLFDFDSAKIKSTYQQTLRDVAQFLSANANTKAVLEGHTDSTGPASYNLILSQAR
uniref:Outer membrane protein and related peptidoglycan-associated (Lipo)protein-like protein n=1 Tax=Psychrobacter sp. (strain PRwf-1) TaxID=349106 RepID=A5WE82_PSYWF